MPEAERRKIALFTSVHESSVLSLVDCPTIYEIPLKLHQQKIDEILLKRFGLHDSTPVAQLSAWANIVEAQKHPLHTVTIGIVGKYTHLLDAYKSIHEALTHAGIHTQTRVLIRYFNAEEIEESGVECLEGCNGILIPGGFGERGILGKIMAIQYAREYKIPFFGICLGMQLAVIEFARNVAHLAGANSTEFDLNTAHPVIAMVTEWLNKDGVQERRDRDSDKGGTMRLGAQVCVLEEDSKAYQAYLTSEILERHRHRYECNKQYMDDFEALGLKVVGRSSDGVLVEMVELADHPWFLACQFHPEFTSTPIKGHPLFIDFIKHSIR
jgi:CTP synthase